MKERESVRERDRERERYSNEAQAGLSPAFNGMSEVWEVGEGEEMGGISN